MVLRPATVSAFASLSADLVGHWRTDAIAGAVALGLFEQLPGTTSEIAGKLGLQADRISALLGALGELQLVQLVCGAWSLTDRGALLRHDHPLTLADAALEYAGPLRQLWADLPAAVRPGWRGPDVFGDVAADPVRAVSHHRMLRSYARHDYPALPKLFALRGHERILDVGGGVGVLAEALLAHQPTLRVTVLDRPEVTAQLPAGVTPLAADLFGAWGVTADVVVLARVLHDWDDDCAAQILEEARRTLPSGGRLFVVELLRAADGCYGGLCDLHLLLATGGRERTAAAYGAMLDRAGFDVVRVHPLATVPSVIEAVAR